MKRRSKTDVSLISSVSSRSIIKFVANQTLSSNNLSNLSSIDSVLECYDMMSLKERTLKIPEAYNP